MASPEKISLYNHSDLKNTSDDAMANYLNSLNFRQSHLMTDVRLGLGYTALIISAACFAWDYKLGWDETKLWTAIAVGLYAALNGALTLWVWLVEEGTVYQGTAPGPEKQQLLIATSTKKYEPVYQLKVAIINEATRDSKAFEFECRFTQFFDETGLFVAAPFQDILAENISLVKKADSKRAAGRKVAQVTGTEDLLEQNPELLDAVLQAEAQTTGSEKKKSGGKRRKA